MGRYAHQDYLDARGTPLLPAELAGHDLTGYDTETPAIRAALAPYPWLGRASLTLRTDSSPAQFAAVVAAFGIGYCQSRFAASTSRLVRVLPDAFALEFGMWVAMHESLRGDPACRAVFDALVAALVAMP